MEGGSPSERFGGHELDRWDAVEAGLRLKMEAHVGIAWVRDRFRNRNAFDLLSIAKHDPEPSLLK